jgi:predicted ferric reductase
MDIARSDGARRVTSAPVVRGGRGRERGYRVAVAWVIGAVVAANAAVIVWLWLRGGGVSGVHGWGDLSTSVGRVTGLLSAYLALLQVLLLARLPWLERLAGFDHLTAWHRLNGKVCLSLVLAHVVFITIGYAAMDRIAIPPEVTRLLGDYPGMVAATVGTALLIAVVATSLVIVRRHLRYEAWYLVHLSAYAGIALAWVHQIPTGNELTANPAAAAYWTALYVATLVLLVLFRIAGPLAGVFWYGLRVAAVTPEGPGVVSLRVTGRRLDRLHARGGQFFLWRFLTPGRWWASHPFSLSAAPDGRSLRLTVKDVGDFTGRVGAIAVGTRVVAEGPFGVFTDAARRRDKVVLIAGGIGITPIRALVEDMPPDLDSALIYRVVRAEDVVFRHELDALARERGVALSYVVGDHTGAEGAYRLSPEHLRDLVPDIADREAYVCGPPAMMRATEANLRRAGVPRASIHSERFAL